jgi:hypothetical protein
MTKKHIFISYRSVEFDQALKIAEHLVQQGYPVWMDRLDGILAGDNWRDKLQEAVNASFAMVSVLSRNYVESEWCKREYQRADMLNTPIFLTKIGEVENEKIPIELQSSQYVDFTGGASEIDKKVSELVAGIKNMTGIEPLANASMPSVTERNPYREDVEDQVDQNIERAYNIRESDSFDAIEAEEIEKDLEMLKKQYLAVSQQYRLTIDANITTKLEAQKENIKNKSKELAQQLKSLNGE